jgi:hypothetical protein
MTPSPEIFRVGLAALLTGIAVPLLVQLFLLLRDLRRTTAVLDRTLTNLDSVVAELKHPAVATPPLAAQLAAAVPAVVAAVRAFRSGMSHDGATPPHPQAKENLT